MKNKIKCAIFDLDGTLINTITDLGNACDNLIQKYGFCANWSEDDYKSFVGNGNRKLVERAFKYTLSGNKLDEMLDEFLEYYAEHSLDNTKPYEGIKEQLLLLKNKGIKLAVITNKNEKAAIKILNSLFGENVFDVIIGQRNGLPVKPAPDGTLLALEILGIKAEEAVYFGDSNVDIQTAKNANISSVGVTWGFRSRQILEDEGADIIIDEPNEITGII